MKIYSTDIFPAVESGGLKRFLSVVIPFYLGTHETLTHNISAFKNYVLDMTIIIKKDCVWVSILLILIIAFSEFLSADKLLESISVN